MSVEASSGIVALARNWDHVLDADVAEGIVLYMRRLLEWNVSVNLTGARTITDLLSEHLPDSFAMSRLVPAGSNVVDVGAGGGLPGVPFALLRPDCSVTLLEPRAKRVAFLNTAVRDCACKNTVVVRARLEEVESNLFDVAVSRATFPPDEWLVLAPRLLISSGRAVALATDAVRLGTDGANGARLMESFKYTTGNGSTRWAGCYCFT